jgi:hypothetical protein
MQIRSGIGTRRGAYFLASAALASAALAGGGRRLGCCCGSRGGCRSGFGVDLTLLARHGLFRVVARGALDDAGGVQEAGHAVRRLCALGEPGLDLVHVELEARLVVLRQQRIEMTETLDEAAVTGKARVGDDDVIDRTLLGACASEADND